MPKKEKPKNEILIDNLKDTDCVQKSTPLMSLWRSDMSLSEFKILDTYLSRINSHNPEQRSVRFEKGELEKLLNVSRLRPEELRERIRGLGRFVPIVNEENRIVEVALFEKAVCQKDEYDLWQIDLTCTPSAMKYVFNVEELGYLRYKLRSIINLQSRYSYILFIYLENNRFRKSWEISLEELRVLLNATEESYNEFKIFNNRILRRTQKELHDKTELKFEYEPIKKGRKVVAIQFTLQTLSDVLPEYDEGDVLKGQISLDEVITIEATDTDPTNKLLLETIPADVHDNNIANVEAIRKIVIDGLAFIPASVSERDAIMCRALDKFHKTTFNRYRKNIKHKEGVFTYYTKALETFMTKYKDEEEHEPSFDVARAEKQARENRVDFGTKKRTRKR